MVAKIITLFMLYLAICSQGCFNNGVCNSPGNCVCATGWTGRDCRTGIHMYLYFTVSIGGQ